MSAPFSKPSPDAESSPIPPTADSRVGLPPETPTLTQRLRRALVGAPRNLRDTRIFHQLSLVPFLAWVGLGADGLSSSAYGPEEAFKSLGQHTYLAVVLALMAGLTVFIISAGY